MPPCARMPSSPSPRPSVRKVSRGWKVDALEKGGTVVEPSAEALCAGDAAGAGEARREARASRSRSMARRAWTSVRRGRSAKASAPSDAPSASTQACTAESSGTSEVGVDGSGAPGRRGMPALCSRARASGASPGGFTAPAAHPRQGRAAAVLPPWPPGHSRAGGVHPGSAAWRSPARRMRPGPPGGRTWQPAGPSGAPR